MGHLPKLAIELANKFKKWNTKVDSSLANAGCIYSFVDCRNDELFMI